VQCTNRTRTSSSVRVAIVKGKGRTRHARRGECREEAIYESNGTAHLISFGQVQARDEARMIRSPASDGPATSLRAVPRGCSLRVT
jgi:hypothetical protein